MRKLKRYQVAYSGHSIARVKAYTVKGAREQAWRLLTGAFTYGWKKADFMRNATVTEMK